MNIDLYPGQPMQVTLNYEKGLSKAETAYTWVREKIVNGDFAAGHRLVLASIGRELDMSVVPVREAIRQLEAEGLVTFERNVGARVAMVDSSAYVESMQTLGIIEGAATALALPHLTAEDIAAARDYNRQLATLLEDFDPKAFTDLNHRFHQVLTHRCPNQHLVDLVGSEWNRLGNLRESTFSFVPGRAAESVAEHDRIIDLIDRCQPAHEVEQAVRDHRQATLTSYLSTIPEPV